MAHRPQVAYSACCYVTVVPHLRNEQAHRCLTLVVGGQLLRILGFPSNVKYSLAHNMRQGKNSHCAVKKVMRRKRLTYELHDSYFRSMMITPAIPKIADMTHPNGQ